MRPLLLLGLLCATFSPSIERQQAPPKTIRIDGSAQPERIPDHWVWRANFLRLSEVKKQGGEAALAHDLPLGKADAEVLYKEAALQPERDAVCLKRIMAMREELRQQSASAEASRRMLNEVTLECRTQDLDAADRVLDSLTEEGRTTLSAWIEKRRRTMVAFVPEEDLAVFRLPR